MLSMRFGVYEHSYNILVACVRSAISVLLPNPSASLCVPLFEKRVLSRTNYLSPVVFRTSACVLAFVS